MPDVGTFFPIPDEDISDADLLAAIEATRPRSAAPSPARKSARPREEDISDADLLAAIQATKPKVVASKPATPGHNLAENLTRTRRMGPLQSTGALLPGVVDTVIGQAKAGAQRAGESTGNLIKAGVQPLADVLDATRPSFSPEGSPEYDADEVERGKARERVQATPAAMKTAMEGLGHDIDPKTGKPKPRVVQRLIENTKAGRPALENFARDYAEYVGEDPAGAIANATALVPAFALAGKGALAGARGAASVTGHAVEDIRMRYGPDGRIQFPDEPAPRLVKPGGGTPSGAKAAAAAGPAKPLPANATRTPMPAPEAPGAPVSPVHDFFRKTMDGDASAASRRTSLAIAQNRFPDTPVGVLQDAQLDAIGEIVDAGRPKRPAVEPPGPTVIAAKAQDAVEAPAGPTMPTPVPDYDPAAFDGTAALDAMRKRGKTATKPDAEPAPVVSPDEASPLPPVQADGVPFAYDSGDATRAIKSLLSKSQAPIPLEDIARSLGWSNTEAAKALTIAEMRGFARRTPGNAFRAPDAPEPVVPATESAAPAPAPKPTKPARTPKAKPAPTPAEPPIITPEPPIIEATPPIIEPTSPSAAPEGFASVSHSTVPLSAPGEAVGLHADMTAQQAHEWSKQNGKTYADAWGHVKYLKNRRQADGLIARNKASQSAMEDFVNKSKSPAALVIRADGGPAVITTNGLYRVDDATGKLKKEIALTPEDFARQIDRHVQQDMAGHRNNAAQDIINKKQAARDAERESVDASRLKQEDDQRAATQRRGEFDEEVEAAVKSLKGSKITATPINDQIPGPRETTQFGHFAIYKTTSPGGEARFGVMHVDSGSPAGRYQTLKEARRAVAAIDPNNDVWSFKKQSDLSPDQYKLSESLFRRSHEIARGGMPADWQSGALTPPALSAKLDALAQPHLDALNKKGGKLTSGIDPEDLYHAAAYMGYKMAKGAVKFAEFSAHAIETFGDWIEPHLDELYTASKRAAAKIKAGEKFGMADVVADAAESAPKAKKPETEMAGSIGKTYSGFGDEEWQRVEERAESSGYNKKASIGFEEQRERARKNALHYDDVKDMEPYQIPPWIETEHDLLDYRRNLRNLFLKAEPEVTAAEAAKAANDTPETRAAYKEAMNKASKLHSLADPSSESSGRTLGMFADTPEPLESPAARMLKDTPRTVKSGPEPAPVPGTQGTRTGPPASTSSVRAVLRDKKLPEWGAANEKKTRAGYDADVQAAREALLEIRQKAGIRQGGGLGTDPGYDSATTAKLLKAVKGIGEFHFEAGAKAFDAWKAAVLDDIGAAASSVLTRTQLFHIHEGLLGEQNKAARQAQVKTAEVVLGQTLRNKFKNGDADVVKFLQDVQDAAPDAIEKHLNNEALTPDEARVWAESEAKYKDGTENRRRSVTPDEALKSARLEIARNARAANPLSPEDAMKRWLAAVVGRDGVDGVMSRNAATIDDLMNRREPGRDARAEFGSDVSENSRPRVSRQETVDAVSEAQQIVRDTKSGKIGTLSAEEVTRRPLIEGVNQLEKAVLKLREKSGGPKKPTFEDQERADFKAEMQAWREEIADDVANVKATGKGAPNYDALGEIQKRHMDRIDAAVGIHSKAGRISVPESEQIAKVGHVIQSALGVWRTLRTTFDISAPGRQGAWQGAKVPATWGKSWAPMLKAWANPAYAHASAIEMRSHPLWTRAMADKLEITDIHARSLDAREEAYRTDLAQRIPGIGKYIEKSDAAYATFLNYQRFSTYVRQVRQMEKSGKPMPESESRALAGLINSATGRAGLHTIGPQVRSFFANTFFSPRWVASRFNVTHDLISQPIRGRSVRLLRRQANEYARAIGTAYAFAKFLQYATGAEPIEADPRSSRFMKLTFKNGFSYDLSLGMGPVLTYMARNIPTSGPQGWKRYTKTWEGQVRPLSSKEVMDTSVKFIRSKLAPAPGMAVDVGTGRNYPGQKLTDAGGFAQALGAPIKSTAAAEADYVASNIFTPIFLTDFTQALKQNEVPGGIALWAAEQVGIPSNFRSPEDYISPPKPKAADVPDWQKGLTGYKMPTFPPVGGGSGGRSGGFGKL